MGKNTQIGMGSFTYLPIREFKEIGICDDGKSAFSF
jgi:hypothetical protein